jgi:hypothetical protein
MSQARIVFINPPYERIAPGYEFVKHITNNSPSLGLLHLVGKGVGSLFLTTDTTERTNPACLAVPASPPAVLSTTY